METILSAKGQAVIPQAVREQARMEPGDKLDVGCVNGLVIFRKRQPLTATQARQLILAGRNLPELTSADEAEVADALKTVRRRRRA